MILFSFFAFFLLLLSRLFTKKNLTSSILTETTSKAIWLLWIEFFNNSIGIWNTWSRRLRLLIDSFQTWFFFFNFPSFFCLHLFVFLLLLHFPFFYFLLHRAMCHLSDLSCGGLTMYVKGKNSVMYQTVERSSPGPYL